MMNQTKAKITEGMTLLDIVSRWPETEAVFRRYDEKAGVCLCCSSLFDTLEEITARHGLDLLKLLQELMDTAANCCASSN